mgnify:FL=1
MPTSTSTASAQVYRMKTVEHMCPFGLKTVDLLKRKGFTVDDNLLASREEIDAFKEQENATQRLKYILAMNVSAAMKNSAST